MSQCRQPQRGFGVAASDIQDRTMELARIDQRREFGLRLADVPRRIALEELTLALICGVPVRKFIRCHTT